jgi:hypothetical protein
MIKLLRSTRELTSQCTAPKLVGGECHKKKAIRNAQALLIVFKKTWVKKFMVEIRHRFFFSYINMVWYINMV